MTILTMGFLTSLFTQPLFTPRTAPNRRTDNLRHIQSGPKRENRSRFLPLTLTNFNRFAQFYYYVKEKKINFQRKPQNILNMCCTPCEITDMFKYDGNLEDNENKMH